MRGRVDHRAVEPRDWLPIRRRGATLAAGVIVQALVLGVIPALVTNALLLVILAELAGGFVLASVGRNWLLAGLGCIGGAMVAGVASGTDAYGALLLGLWVTVLVLAPGYLLGAAARPLDPAAPPERRGAELVLAALIMIGDVVAVIAVLSSLGPIGP